MKNYEKVVSRKTTTKVTIIWYRKSLQKSFHVTPKLWKWVHTLMPKHIMKVHHHSYIICIQWDIHLGSMRNYMSKKEDAERVTISDRRVHVSMRKERMFLR